MVRPVTCLCVGMAIWSGLYLYQSKHASQLLDRQIEKTVRETDTVRDQIRLLHAEWMLLNDPERLRQYANKYLALKTVIPGQFTSLSDLQHRLPAPVLPRPRSVTTDEDPDADTISDQPMPRPAAEPAPVIVADEVMPLPPVLVPPPSTLAERRPAPVAPRQTQPDPLPRSAVADSLPPRPAPPAEPRPAAPRPPEHRAAEIRPPDMRHAEQRPVDSRPAEPRVTASVPRPSVASPVQTVAASPQVPAQPVVQRVALQQPVAAQAPQPQAAPRPAPQRVAAATPAYQPIPQTVATAAPMGGSMLGMARGSSPPAPLPRPMPAAGNVWNGGN